MIAPNEVRAALLAAVPNLRAFAVSLCGNIDRANDLVQETLLRAWSHLDSFKPGTNMAAWLFTILRNHFRTEYRKRRREVEDADGEYAARLTTPESQTAHIEFGELRQALAALPPNQREALILIGASGFSYEEAAQICDCAVGTIRAGSIAPGCDSRKFWHRAARGNGLMEPASSPNRSQARSFDVSRGCLDYPAILQERNGLLFIEVLSAWTATISRRRMTWLSTVLDWIQQPGSPRLLNIPMTRS
jgi:RNA polymerase sigma-70 factor, ECF subfamily